MFDFKSLNLAEVEQQDHDFTPLPAGQYLTVIESAEVKQFGQSTDWTLFMKYAVTDGDYQNRKLTSFFTMSTDNILHQSEEQRKRRETRINIGRSNLLRSAQAIDPKKSTDQIQDTLAKHGAAWFVGKSVAVAVDVRQPKDMSKQPQNQITKWYNKTQYDKTKTPKKKVNKALQSALADQNKQVEDFSDDDLLF